MSVFIAGKMYVGVVGARARRRDVCERGVHIRMRERMYMGTHCEVIADSLRDFS